MSNDDAGSKGGTATGGRSDQEPVVVWEAANVLEAEIVKGRLEAEGIPAFISNEAAGHIFGLTSVGLARANVMVPAPLADRAIEVLSSDVEADDEAEMPE